MMKLTTILTTLVAGLAAATCAQAQVQQESGSVPGATHVLDFDSPATSLGPVDPTDSTFTSAGLARVELTGAWVDRGDIVTPGANTDGHLLAWSLGGLSIVAPGSTLYDPIPLASLEVELDAPAVAFGVQFVDQLNFDYRLELFLGATSLGQEEFRYEDLTGFPAEPHFWTANGALFDRVHVRFHEFITGVGFDGFAWESIGNEIGTRHCSPAVVNSTGQDARMAVVGSPLIANQTLELRTTRLPLNAFGFFLTGPMRAAIPQPGGSQGVLCVSGGIGRYVGPGQLRNSGTSGEFALLVDVTQHPTPTGLRPIVAGETWSFTSWYRDGFGGSATSNFADAVEVVFQ